MEPAELAVLAAGMTRIRRCVDRVNLAIAIRSEALAGQGAGGGAEDLFNRDTPGTGEGRRQARRAKASKAAPKMGDAVADGTFAAEYLDVIARITAKFDATLAKPSRPSTPNIAEAAGRMDVHAFTCGAATDSNNSRRSWDVIATNANDATPGPALGRRLHRAYTTSAPRSTRSWANDCSTALDADVNALRAMNAAQRDEHCPASSSRAWKPTAIISLAHCSRPDDHRRSPHQPARRRRSLHLRRRHTLQHGAHDDSVCEYSDGTPCIRGHRSAPGLRQPPAAGDHGHHRRGSGTRS
jgi:hypothetical protein